MSGGGSEHEPVPPVPVLDIARLRVGGGGRDAFLAELLAAAADPGFFALTGHGVPEPLSAGVLAQARAFFALPEADRLAIENIHSPHFRGYTQVGNERTGGRADRREQLDVGAERPAPVLGPHDPAYLRLDGPNQWPAALPGLREALLPWMEAVAALAAEVLGALAAALGQPAHFFDDTFGDDPHLHVKVIRYPGRDDGGDDQGVGAHRDYGYLALLVQDDTGGLQIARPDGGFAAVPPLPGSFVVNLGEMLEVASGGVLRATVHRVRSPPPGRERLSLAFFYNPRLSATVRRIPLPPHLQAAAGGQPPVDPDNPLFAEYGRNALKGWLRAHPRVAERHWSDVSA